MFFDRLSEACVLRKTSPSAVALQVGRSKSNVTGWKKGQVPASDTVIAIAKELDIPLDFLLERPPFDCWSAINENRAGFLHYVDIDPDVLSVIWGIDTNAPENTSMLEFVQFLQSAVSNVRATEDGGWEVELKSAYKQKKAPVLTLKDERDIARDVESIMDNLAGSGELMFDGVPMSEEAKAAMSAAMRIGLEQARILNKRTYTPKKYRKE